jgi:2-oxo-4-hydroxy-4-carboxy-5-ureidoimidazoline decarboxylase
VTSSARDLDAASADAAAAELAPLFEGAPRFLARLVAERPFGTWEALFARAREVAHAIPEAEQLELIDAHPRLGAPRETVSIASAREQGYERLGTSATGPHGEPAGALERLNAAYEARFGFRYCVFVAGRPLAALVPELERAIGARREVELHRALDAVVDIAVARQAAGR